MKPIYLEFCGLNSFEDKAQIDFAKLLSGGVFGIFGDTGSGKSTILDSIHFALYGEIDRAPKSFNECINYRSDGAYVTFDFEISTEGVRHVYRVKRERRRKSGTTKAYLYERTPNGELMALAEGTRDVDERIEKIIGLTFADFKMCIALPQGDFSALVKSTQAERVKLVARLFNLEKYGERLSKAVNEKYFSAEEEVNLIRAKMEENEGGDEARFESLKGEIAKEKQTLASSKKQLEERQTRLQDLLALQKEKQAYEALKGKLDLYSARLEEMQEKRTLLDKLPKAQAVAEKIALVKEAQKQKETALNRAELAQNNAKDKTAFLQKEKARMEEANYEEKILDVSMQLQKVKEASKDRENAEKARLDYENCIAQFRALKDKCPQENFAEKREALEKEIALLGEDETLLDYLKNHYKGVLLADTYGEIRQDLKTLGERYPETEEAVQTLIKKYAPPTADKDMPDIAMINLSFKETERKRKALRAEQEKLINRQRDFALNEEKIAWITQQGKQLKQTYTLALEKIAHVQGLGTEEALTQKLNHLKAEQTETQSRIERFQAEINGYLADEQAQKELYALHANTEKTLAAAVESTLQANGFQTENEANALIEKLGDGLAVAQECKNFFEEYEVCHRQYAQMDISKFDGFAETLVEEERQTLATEKEAHDTLVRSLNFKEATIERLLTLREKYKEQTKLLAEKQKHLQTCDELRLLLRGNKFLEFIACEYLQEICILASKTLLSLTGGRYFLQYDKEFKIGDNLNGGELRAVKTLSGGETFLVSLSLALSLSASICQKSARPIEFFFLDEGFGTLDEKLVETVMDVLGKLSKTFSVGLISHVEELKRRIENKILVTGANERHGSQLRVETLL